MSTKEKIDDKHIIKVEMVGLVEMWASSQNNVVFTSKPYMVDHGARWWIGWLVDLHIIHSTKFTMWTLPSKPTLYWKGRRGGGLRRNGHGLGQWGHTLQLGPRGREVDGIRMWVSTCTRSSAGLSTCSLSPLEKWSPSWWSTWDGSHWMEG